mmetsp:Transcript_53052/g.126847  ORF Transcript_53052/g.126847 Transcript_53052/m.126847 type:complete len:269 (+) Transcript_53052:105-911(+)
MAASHACSTSLQDSNRCEAHGFQELLVVHCLEGHRTILTPHVEDGIRAAWVLPNVLGHVVDMAVERYPEIPLCTVLLQLLLRDLRQGCLLRLGRRVQGRRSRHFGRLLALPDGQVHADAAPEDGALQKGVSSQSVVTVHSSAGLAGCVEAWHDLALCIQYLAMSVDGDPPHCVVDHWHHLTHVEVLRSLNGPVLGEDFAAKGIDALLRCGVVVHQRGVDNVYLKAKAFCKALNSFGFGQKPFLGVERHVPVGHFGGLAIQNQGKGTVG